MARNPYGSYRGRKSWGKRILIGIVVVLVIALILAVVGVVFLRDHIVYTDHGIEFTLSFGKKESPAPESVSPSPPPSQSEFVIETPSPSPSPSPSATLRPEMAPRRDAPLGLVGAELSALLDGTAADALSDGRGAIFDMTGADLTSSSLREKVLALPYAVAFVRWDGNTDQLEALAGLGFDEILLQGVEETNADAPRKALDNLGYLGRLSVVGESAPFLNDTSLAQTLAKEFDRVYVPGGGWGEFNLYSYLKGHEFRGTTADIVTVVSKPLTANYAWAVLPKVPEE